MTAPLDPQAYQPHIGTEFTLTAPDGTRQTLKLETVKERINDEVQHAFSLHFLGSGPLLEQYLFPLSHPVLGGFDLFLVPIQKKKHGVVYEAVFNLLREEPQ